MEASGVEAVLDFLRKNGFAEAESALRDDIVDKGELGSFDFEKFMFPMANLPPPVKIVVSGRRSEIAKGVECSGSTSDSSDDFVSVGSSATDVSPSAFTNPYGLWSATKVKSEDSSDVLSEFGTARDYHDSDMLTDMYRYDEKDEGYVKYPCFRGSDFFCCQSEDKFVTLETEKECQKPLGLSYASEGFHSVTSINYLDKPCLLNSTSTDDYYNWDENTRPERSVEMGSEGCTGYSCSVSLGECCMGTKRSYGVDSEDYNHLKSLKEPELNDLQLKLLGESPTDCDSALEHRRSKSSDHHSIRKRATNYLDGEFQNNYDLHLQAAEKASLLDADDGDEIGDGGDLVGEPHKPGAAGDEEEGVTDNELLMYGIHEDEYEVFNLRIIHRKNRTGFEENKDLPIILNTIIAGRYYVTEYLGSAAFSRVVQAHDLHTGTDVCLKIIKNDKDFFDQSLDEIKLLKFVNKHDPADENHILRLYDYFYHQEHLFIVCELLRANLYEFQKFNQDSGSEAYFTLPRLQVCLISPYDLKMPSFWLCAFWFKSGDLLFQGFVVVVAKGTSWWGVDCSFSQVITRQCLEALEYLHHLGIIHCDLKPENILIKSYSRCEIKVIDLGSSCFQMDNLCLYVQSRSYRAPEVILGLSYDQKIDIWSLGCILAELCSGDVLFPNDALIMLLARMVGMLGPIDMEMLVKGQETHKYFTKEYDLYHINEETNQMEYIIPEESSLEHHLQVSDIGFTEFIKDLLETNPGRRPTAREALEHPWLSYSYESNSS
ncbi:hypothetical protein HHK36_010735 [Tetracentron sinense]|uniref:Protein kinase domain-containing protein n=1 Tax=Tetracentron sinense TaxID=13715 RepID=A0A835DGP9_TETSI|nr:hypothetical protein HHK36_010735 [Tetracentron sinense]